MVKYKVIFEGGDNVRVRGRVSTAAGQGSGMASEIEYDVSANLPLDSHLQNILQALKAMNFPVSEEISSYCLQSGSGTLFDPDRPLQDQLAEQSQKVIIVKLKPRLRAERHLAQLRNPDANIKEEVFTLREQLQVSRPAKF